MNANSWSPTWRTKSSGMSRSGPRGALQTMATLRA
jgi:hypothetical protein